MVYLFLEEVKGDIVKSFSYTLIIQESYDLSYLALQTPSI